MSSTSATAGYRLHHSMIRVRDPVKSRAFYEGLLGMRLVAKKDFPAGSFSLYFYTYLDSTITLPKDEEEQWKFLWTIKSHCVELTHNWGTETDEKFAGYHTGNSEPRGFGHLCIAVPDVYDTVARLEKQGVKIVKHPDAGTMKGLAFVADPDGYWIEVVKDGADPNVSAKI